MFSGISTFGRLPYYPCLASDEEKFDIAFLGIYIVSFRPEYLIAAYISNTDILSPGAPFDTGTSYRPGARFGPSGIRQGSRRLNLYGGYNVPLETNPFNSWARVLDCGDIPVTSSVSLFLLPSLPLRLGYLLTSDRYDNDYAIKQIENGHLALLSRTPATDANKSGPSLKGKTLPRVITLGGDHTIVLPILRSVTKMYGPISVIHFDSHLDTWKPKVFGGSLSKTASVNHGTYFVSILISLPLLPLELC